jgi:hypothetical protein
MMNLGLEGKTPQATFPSPQHSPHYQPRPRPRPRPQWGQANTSLQTESNLARPLQYMTDQTAVYPGPLPPLVRVSELGKTLDENAAQVLLALSNGT